MTNIEFILSSALVHGPDSFTPANALALLLSMLVPCYPARQMDEMCLSLPLAFSSK